MYSYNCFLILLFLTVALDVSYGIRVNISTGVIEGENVFSKITGKSYYSFRGIPYAEPPLGKLRFMPPFPPQHWGHVLQTKKNGPQCMQGSGGSEDCLYLNVYAPVFHYNYNTSMLLPVMVFIHGGMYTEGTSNSSQCGPDYLINKDVVLVTFSYRLNIFGFLNVMEESAPGNAGLKDQVAALKWVQENIKKFNGDPKQVTLFGESAGASSVLYHMQSKLSKGLFHRAIIQCGSTLNNWAFEADPIDVLHKLGHVLNIDTKNITQFVSTLKKLPAQNLQQVSYKKELLADKNRVIPFRFVPSLEFDSPGAFITENSYSLLQNNKVHSVPCIIGQVSNEGRDLEKNKIKNYLNDPMLLVPLSLNIFNDTKREMYVSEEIFNEYFKNILTPIKNIINYETDETFIRGIRKTVEFLRKSNKIFYYVIDYEFKNDKLLYSRAGMNHTSDLKLLFPRKEENYTENILIIERLTTLWTNFAKTGNPTPYQDTKLNNITWPTLSKETTEFNYLYIGDYLQIKTNLWERKYKFWERIFSKFGNPPFYTY